MNGKREYGDYQTPDSFAFDVCKYLKDTRKLNPSIVIEPTCGTGSFIKNSLIFGARKIIGIELNPKYCKSCIDEISDNRVQIINADIFSIDLSNIIKNDSDILVIGNPPWVTNSTLSTFNSINLPQKVNFKGLRGIDALTGASNFDICEYIILQLISALRGKRATIAMLCKTSVARNIFSELHRNYISFSACDILEFNANKVFGINASACLLVIELSNNNVTSAFCNVYSFYEPKIITNKILYNSGRLQNQVTHINNFLGKSCFEWRQGVKHDCSKIMELSLQNKSMINGLSEEVDIESCFVYPLVKSSMFKSVIIDRSDRYVIVTQKSIGEDTSHIKRDAPKTWNYLFSHKAFFEKRKSAIYKNTPAFAMFGVGEYSYATYKVGVSGFYKKPLFSLLSAKSGCPIMTDDTSYFICLPTYDTAYTTMLILNSSIVQKYICSIAFLDSKRPFTKRVLDQIDFRKVLDVISVDDLIETEKQLGLVKRFNENMLIDFKCLPEFGQIKLPLYASGHNIK
ncbi:MAG: hypothetical protein KBS54_02705 [Synergistaceae bacterium]|nr:hypothetical protein [Candidatus Equadaptatus faecalis]